MGLYCKYSKSATLLRSVLLQPLRSSEHALHSSHFQLNHICVVFDLFSASVLKKKNKTNGVTVFQSAQLFWGEKEPSSGAYLAWNASGGRVTLSARFLHLVCWVQSIRVGWLDRRGATGSLCVCMERCAEWITFPGNSCQIHQSRAEDRRAGPTRPNPDIRLIGVDGRGGGRGLICLPALNAGLKGFWWVATPSLLTGVSAPGQLIV